MKTILIANFMFLMFYIIVYPLTNTDWIHLNNYEKFIFTIIPHTVLIYFLVSSEIKEKVSDKEFELLSENVKKSNTENKEIDQKNVLLFKK